MMEHANRRPKNGKSDQHFVPGAASAEAALVSGADTAARGRSCQQRVPGCQLPLLPLPPYRV